MTKIRVLIVEDEIVVAEDLQQRLAKMGYDVVGAADNRADAVRLAREKRPDVALMDIMLHGEAEGIAAAEELKNEFDIPVIYLTAHSDAATLRRAKTTDPAGFVIKPFGEPQLRAALELAPHRHSMERKAKVVSQWMKATLTSIGDAVIASDPDGKILLLNPAAEEFTGWSREEALGRPCEEVLRLIDAKTREPVEDPARCALKYGVVVRLARDTLLVHRDGTERYVDDSAAPISDDGGGLLGSVVVLTDATTRAAAGQRVRELTRQVDGLLAEKNRLDTLGNELETFATAVSHDLRQPLNAVVAYSDLLSESYGATLDADGQLFLQRVRQGAHQMTAMMRDYLSFLILSRDQPQRRAWVDMSEAAESVFEELTSLPEQGKVKFICPEMVPAWADPSMVRQVLANLLGNAVKYSSKREDAVVELGAVAGDDHHTYWIRDNGVGLDAANAEKLFEPFQRFHSPSQFPGTGVGLAIVKRVLDRLGGRIWVQSRPGEGATFYFTLPARAAEGDEMTSNPLKRSTSTPTPAAT